MVIDPLTLCRLSKNKTMKFHKICHITDFFFPEKSLVQKSLCLSMWEWPNLFSLIEFVFIGQKMLCLSKCGNGQICFHWSNLFSSAISIFTGRIYFVAYMVPQKLIFFSEKSLAQRRLCLSMWEWPNLFSLIKSIFIGRKMLCLSMWE